MPSVSTVTNILASLTLFSNIFLLLLTFYSLLRLKIKIAVLEKLLALLGRRALLLAFLVALASTVGSLFYSEIANFTPCELCWYQRIFMYPQAVILLLALLWRDSKVANYIMALCLIGGAFSSYHYYLQLFPPAALFCAAGASCSARVIFSYGYITIAFMALSASALNFALMILFKKRDSLSCLTGRQIPVEPLTLK